MIDLHNHLLGEAWPAGNRGEALAATPAPGRRVPILQAARNYWG